MPTLNEHGESIAGASGGGSGPLSINGIGVPGFPSISQPRWIGPSTIIAINPSTDEVYRMDRQTFTKMPLNMKANWLVAGDGEWACAAATSPWAYHDSFGRSLSSGWRPLAATSRGILAIHHATDDHLSLIDLHTIYPLLPSGNKIFRSDADISPDHWVARKSATEVWVDGEIVEIPGSADLKMAYPYIVTSIGGRGLSIVDLRDGKFSVITETDMVYPDIILKQGIVTITASLTTGEAPSDVKMWRFHPDQREWEGGIVVTPPTPPLPLKYFDPHPRPMWIAPYHVVTDRWGDDIDPPGNAILVTTESVGEHPEVSRARTRRAGERVVPLFLDPPSYDPSVASLVVGLYLHSPTREALQSYVAVTEAAIQNRQLPDVPLVCYIDQAGAFDDMTDTGKWGFLDPARHWLSPQLYVEAHETPGEFWERCLYAAVEAELAEFYCLPTWCAYDRNGGITEDELLAIQPLLGTLLHQSSVIGVLPFSDMRQGGEPLVGGMNLYPEVKAWIHATQRANPEDRPHRWSYFHPRFVPLTTVLKQKLLQDRELVHFSGDEKTELLRRLG